MWWATRRGNVQYHDAPRRPGWGITVGGVPTLAELADLLTAQRELEGPELPAEDLLTPGSRAERGLHEGGRGGLGVADRLYVVARGASAVGQLATLVRRTGKARDDAPFRPRRHSLA